MTAFTTRLLERRSAKGAFAAARANGGVAPKAVIGQTSSSWLPTTLPAMSNPFK
jgi:hypothetical protein